MYIFVCVNRICTLSRRYITIKKMIGFISFISLFLLLNACQHEEIKIEQRDVMEVNIKSVLEDYGDWYISDLNMTLSPTGELNYFKTIITNPNFKQSNIVLFHHELGNQITVEKHDMVLVSTSNESNITLSEVSDFFDRTKSFIIDRADHNAYIKVWENERTNHSFNEDADVYVLNSIGELDAIDHNEEFNGYVMYVVSNEHIYFITVASDLLKSMN